MGPQLRQLNVTYVKAEDRLLFKVSTSADEEYRIWCTRRFTRLLLERLEVLFADEMPAQATVPEAARREVAQIQHTQKVTEKSFAQPYEAEPAVYPLGEEGVLATTLSYTPKAGGTIELRLNNADGKGCTLNLNPSMQHQVYELFRRAADKAEWFAAAAPTPPPVVH
jgi:hypothetical protein